MVFLAITPGGLNDALREAAGSGTAIWCGADAVSGQDFAGLKGKGLTRFSHALGAREQPVLEDVLDAIGQHHPNAIVWVEAAASAR